MHTIRPDEFYLWCDKKCRISMPSSGLPPWRRCPVWSKNDPGTMTKEFQQPRQKAISATKRWIAPDKPSPLEIQAAFGYEINCWNPRRDCGAGTCNIHIEVHSKRFEHIWWCIPFIAHPRHFMKGHGYSAIPNKSGCRAPNLRNQCARQNASSGCPRSMIIPAQMSGLDPGLIAMAGSPQVVQVKITPPPPPSDKAVPPYPQAKTSRHRDASLSPAHA
jgi:hypothetical protein